MWGVLELPGRGWRLDVSWKELPPLCRCCSKASVSSMSGWFLDMFLCWPAILFSFFPLFSWMHRGVVLSVHQIHELWRLLAHFTFLLVFLTHLGCRRLCCFAFWTTLISSWFLQLIVDSHFSPCVLSVDALCILGRRLLFPRCWARKTSSSSANSDCRSPLSNLAASKNR